MSVTQTTQTVYLTDDDYRNRLSGAGLPLLVQFRAGFCGPSEALAPVVEQVAAEYHGRILYAEVDVEECPKMSREFSVKGTPTLMIFDLGVPLASMIGTMTAKQASEWLEKVLNK